MAKLKLLKTIKLKLLQRLNIRLINQTFWINTTENPTRQKGRRIQRIVWILRMIDVLHFDASKLLFYVRLGQYMENTWNPMENQLNVAFLTNGPERDYVITS